MPDNDIGGHRLEARLQTTNGEDRSREATVWGAVVWSLVILCVFAPLAVSRYRRTAGR